MTGVVWTALTLHLLASALPSGLVTRRLPDVDIERMRQHHEKCVMLAVIALCILYK